MGYDLFGDRLEGLLGDWSDAVSLCCLGIGALAVLSQ